MQEDLSEWVEKARALQPALKAKARAHEVAGTLEDDVITALRTNGLLNLVAPKIYGGQETNYTILAATIAEIAEACMSTAWVAAVGNAHNWMVTGFGERAQSEYYADPEVFSSASFAPTGSATLVPDGLIADGRWSFLSGVDHAQWVFLTGLARNSVDDRPAGPWCMMIPIDAVTIDHNSWQVTGLSGTGSKDVILNQVEVPAHRAVYLPALRGNQGPGQGSHAGQLFSTPFHAALISILAAPILGAGRGALKQFQTYTSDRVVKMTGEKQAEQATSQVILAECAAAIDAAGAVLERTFSNIDQIRPPDPALVGKVPRDTAYAVRLICQAVNTMMANAGGSSAKLENPLQRSWRDIQTASNHAALNWASAAQQWGKAALQV